ncbi:hypothetical protein [Streptomyces mirabilis]|uniref:hypothetical protein n=1 Tax=Streptomyces mirabilis TaxID=68239 RepID=UPI00331DF806
MTRKAQESSAAVTAARPLSGGCRTIAARLDGDDEVRLTAMGQAQGLDLGKANLFFSLAAARTGEHERAGNWMDGYLQQSRRPGSTRLEKSPGNRPPDTRAAARAVQQIEYVSDDSADPHVDPRHIAENQDLERFIQLRADGPRAMDADVLGARARHARLTGESGDSRGAAALCQRLGQDCARLLGPDHDRVFEAYREASRWKEGTG